MFTKVTERMKTIFLLLALLFNLHTHAQTQTPGTKLVQTSISTKNNFELSIIQVFPQEFPKVSVVFQAKNELGEPLWLLTKNDFNVSENKFDCEVIDVRNISEKKPLNIALVFDHSASMIENPLQMTDSLLNYQTLFFEGKLPKGYVMSIDYAKEAVLNFFKTENQADDSLFFVGFSSKVDKIKPLSNNFDRFSTTVKNVRPSGSTAFYDALYTAIDSLKNHCSAPALIALTDGADNASTHTYLEVIDFGNKHHVPIYIIGLGNVHTNSLGKICTETNGFFYHTNDPTTLTEIYANIKRQIRSIYELDYLSNEDNSDDLSRMIQFNFTNDTLAFNPNEYEFDLPEEVVEHLQIRHAELRKIQEELDKEDARLKTEEEEAAAEMNLLIGAGIGGILLLGIGGFVLLRRKKENQPPKIIAVYPNPFEGRLTVNYFTPENAILSISTSNGTHVKDLEFSSDVNLQRIDLSELDTGLYLFTLRTKDASSNTAKAVKG